MEHPDKPGNQPPTSGDEPDAAVHQIVIEPSGPLPPVPGSPLVDNALFLCLLAPFIGWQTGHLIWGVVAIPVVFVVLVFLGGRHHLSRINRACEQLVAEGRPLDIVPYLQQCQAAYPKSPVISALLDQAAQALVLAHQTVQHQTESAETESGETESGETGSGETGSPVVLTIAPDSALPPGPVDKVVSGTAVAAWILATFVFVPFVGVLPALALLVLGILLLVSPTHLLNRKVGGAAVVLAVLAISVTAVMIFWGHFGLGPAQTFKVKAAPWTFKAVAVVVLILSIVLHECAHGLAAWWAGDTTARDEGRLTLNPIPHVDLFGSIILPGILALVPGGLIFGWAKPVPVNPMRYRRHRLGNIGVSLAGVSVNMMLAAGCALALATLGIILRAAYPDLTVTGFAEPFQSTRFTGIPSPGFVGLVADALKVGVVINAVLANLNALPIPPLDGFHVLLSMLPERWAAKLGKLSAYGFMIFLGLLFFKVIDFMLVPGVIIAVVLLSTAASAGNMF